MSSYRTLRSGLARAWFATLAVLLFAVFAIAQDLSPDTLANAGKAHYKERRYGEALKVFEELIAKHPKHDAVKGGNAAWYAARCLRSLGRHADAVTTLTAYRKAHPKGGGTFGALVQLVWAHDALEQDDEAQATAKLLFKQFPDAKDTFPVLLHYVLEGWKVPKLATSAKVMDHWTFTRVDGRRHPDARLAFIELLRKADPKADLFKKGGVLYCQAWAHQQAGRYVEAAALGEKYLKKYPRGSNRDKTRIMLAELYLALPSPDLDRARKHIEKVLANDKSRYLSRAAELLTRARTRGDPKQLEPGLPKAEGLGKVVVLSNLPANDSYLRALSTWREARGADIVHFRGEDVSTARKALTKRGAEYVAVVVRPETVDMNFHLGLLEFCRDLDWDPLPDFRFGYLTARNAADLEAFAARILAKEEAGGTKAAVGGLSSGSGVSTNDYYLHFGHGLPWGVQQGLSGEQVSALKLENAPIVYSGACFNGVLSRSYHRCAYQPVFMVPDTIEPEKLISLGWVHAGASGLFAALEADRGEMAMTEWAYFQTTAEPLGAVIDHQYRLAFTSLPIDFQGFPRYEPGARKRMSYYSVMLRGAISRILLSDPSYRPLKAPLIEPANQSFLELEPGALKVTVKVLRRSQPVHENYLPLSGKDRFDSRVTERIALPEGFDGILGPVDIAIDAGGKTVKLSAQRIRHEAWGGRRYVTVHVESSDANLAQGGSTITFAFPIEH